eukprot:c23805_g3_i1 orf=42-266(+)
MCRINGELRGGKKMVKEKKGETWERRWPLRLSKDKAPREMEVACTFENDDFAQDLCLLSIGLIPLPFTSVYVLD